MSDADKRYATQLRIVEGALPAAANWTLWPFLADPFPSLLAAGRDDRDISFAIRAGEELVVAVRATAGGSQIGFYGQPTAIIPVEGAPDRVVEKAINMAFGHLEGLARAAGIGHMRVWGSPPTARSQLPSFVDTEAVRRLMKGSVTIRAVADLKDKESPFLTDIQSIRAWGRTALTIDCPKGDALGPCFDLWVKQGFTPALAAKIPDLVDGGRCRVYAARAGTEILAAQMIIWGMDISLCWIAGSSTDEKGAHAGICILDRALAEAAECGVRLFDMGALVGETDSLRGAAGWIKARTIRHVYSVAWTMTVDSTADKG